MSKTAAAAGANGTGQANKRKFTCSPADLYAVARQGWDYYDAVQPLFAERNSMFTPELSANARQRINDAEAMPNEEARREPSSTALVEMKDLNEAVTTQWQILEFAIRQAFPATAMIELNAAGYPYYQEALSEQWGNAESLIVATNEYLKIKESTLVNEGGLPAAFTVNFTNLGKDFTTVRQEKISATGSAKSGTTNKIAADNAVYEELMMMFNMGKIIYRKNEAELWKFTFERLLDEVRGKHPASLAGVVADEVARKAIVNATITAVLLDDALIATEYTATTDEKGRFELKMQAGDFQVTITAPGYEPFVLEKRRLRPGVTGRLKVPLKPEEN